MTGRDKRKVRLVARFQWPLQARILRARIPEFIAQRPELDLVVEIPEAELGVTEKVMKAMSLGRHEADILDLHSNFEVALAVKGDLRHGFLDLTDLVTDVKDQFVGWEPCTWHGRVYGLPSMLAGSAYYYRDDIFSDLGIDPNAFDTWDDFIRAGKEVKQATGAYMTPLDTASFNQFQPLALHNGGGWFDASGKLILDQERTVEALQLYQDLLLRHEVAWPATQFYGPATWQAFREGCIVGAYMPEWFGANEMRHNLPDMAGRFRIAVAPAFHAGEGRSGYRGGMCACVVRGPNEDVAFELLRFSRLTLPAQIATFKEEFLAPSMLAAYDDPTVADYEYGFLGGQKVGHVYARMARLLQPFHVGEQLMEVQQILNSRVIPDVTSGVAKPKQALREAAGEVRLNPITLQKALKSDGNDALRVKGD